MDKNRDFPKPIKVFANGIFGKHHKIFQRSKVISQKLKLFSTMIMV